MKNVVTLVILFLILGFNSFGQTLAEFEKKYPSDKFFEIRPKVLMRSEFTKDGQVCRIVLQPNHYSRTENTIYIGNTTLETGGIYGVLDELAPPHTREGKGQSDGYMTAGGMIFGGFHYENLAIGVRTSWAQRTQAQIVPKDPYESTRDELFKFLNSSMGPWETVIITWTKRSCAE